MGKVADANLSPWVGTMVSDELVGHHGLGHSSSADVMMNTSLGKSIVAESPLLAGTDSSAWTSVDDLGPGSMLELGRSDLHVAMQTDLQTEVQTKMGVEMQMMLDAQLSKLKANPKFSKEEQPDQYVKEKPATWSDKMWSKYKRAVDFICGGDCRSSLLVNGAASIAAIWIPNNPLLKIIFIMYTNKDEDDYPYLPQGTGIFTYTLPDQVG